MITFMKSSIFSKSIIFLFSLLFLIVPLLFTSVNDELFEFNKMLAVYGFTIVIGTFWIFASIAERKIIWKRTPLDIPLGLFLLSQILSTLFSLNLRTSLLGYYSRFNGGLFSTICYIFLFYMFVFFAQKKYLRGLINSILIGGVLSALFAFPEHFGHSPSCLIFTGNFNVSCWVQDVQSRVFGTFGQPNWLAAYLGMLLPLALVNSKTVETEIKLMDDGESKWIQSLLRVGMAVLFIAVLFFTGSRSGIGAVGIGLLALALSISFLWYKAKTTTQTKHVNTALKQYAFMLGLTCASVAIISLLVPNPIQQKLNSFLGPKHIQTSIVTNEPALALGGSESGVIRDVVWGGAIRVWKRYPLFGSGVETFAFSYYKDRSKDHNLLSEWDFLYNKAHNEFLNYLATTGSFGFLTYIALIVCFIILPIKTAFTIFKSKDKLWKLQSDSLLHDIFMLVSLSTGIIIISFSNFYGFSTVMVSLLTFIFPAVSIAIAESYKLESKTDTKLIAINSTSWVAICCFGCLSLLALNYVFTLWKADVAFARGKQLDAAGQLGLGYSSLHQATLMVPEEPTFHDELSFSLASLAVNFARQKDATKAADFASQAIQESDLTINLNPVHTNFWKTRIKVFLTLAQLDQHFYINANEALISAEALSPTDPKLVYYQAMLAENNADKTNFVNLLKKAIDLKPNFEEARNALAKYYESKKQYDEAIAQYQYMIKFINPMNQLAKDRIASLSAKNK